jgi:hypothetical protein
LRPRLNKSPHAVTLRKATDIQAFQVKDTNKELNSYSYITNSGTVQVLQTKNFSSELQVSSDDLLNRAYRQGKE